MTATENVNDTIVECKIMNSDENVHNQNFKSCTLDATTYTLTIIPWFVGEYSVSNARVVLDNMKVINIPTTVNKSLYGSVNYFRSAGSASLEKVGNATLDFTVAGSDISGKAFPTNYPTLKKYWGQANTEVDLEFGLISNFPINETCRVTIDFPYYYGRGLSTRSSSPFCTIDNVPTRCTVNTRSLTLDGFPVSKSVNTAFTIRIGGVAAPPSGSVADNFWIQVNQKNSEGADSVVYAGNLKDVLPTATSIVPLHVNWHTSSSLVTRSLTTLTWVINAINTEDHNNTRAVQVIFPPWWGLSTGRFTPTCRVFDYAITTNILSGTQSIFGNRVHLPISSTIGASRIFNLECQNIRTPEYDGSYPSQDIQIRIVDTTTTSTTQPTIIYQHSVPSVHNVNYNMQYQKLSNLNYIDWKDNTISGIHTAPGAIPLKRGTFGVAMQLNVPGRSSRNFQLNVAPASFSFHENEFNVSIGYDSYFTALGCGGSVPVNTYSLLFTISDNSVYTVPAAQLIQVISDKEEFLVDGGGEVSIEFTTGITSISNPVTFMAVPFTDVTITPRVTVVDNTNFTVRPDSVTLDPTITWGAFIYSTTGSTTATGGSAQWDYTLSGTNAASYNAPASQTIKTVADTNNYLAATPTLTITSDGSDQSVATSKSINFNLGGVDTGTVYWGCQIVGTWILDNAGIYRNAVSWGMLDEWAPQQGQYDWEILNKQTTAKLVEGLIPNTWYDCRGFVESQSAKNSSIASFTFRTGGNGASYNRFLFNHSTYPNPAQRQVLLCTIIQRLAVPKFSVIAVTGETCGNTTAFYNTDNSSGVLAVYFHPRQVNNDDVMTLAALQTALNTTINFQSFNASVVNNGGVAINNILADGQPKRAAISSSFPSNGQTTLTSVSVSGCTLNDTGYIVAVLGSNQSTASPYNLFTGMSTDGSSYYGYQVAYYAPSLGSVGFNFSGLSSSTTYNLFLAGSIDDPSPWFTNTTSVTTLSLTTQTPEDISGLALFSSVIMALVAMISILL